jgi:hypothetical protein
MHWRKVHVPDIRYERNIILRDEGEAGCVSKIQVGFMLIPKG